jgi:hypothetical protein
VEASVLTTDAATERPVFVAADDRRARWLRYGGAFAVLLGCLWLAALAIGMLGIGHLPGLSLPSLVSRDDGAPREHVRPNVNSSSPASPAADMPQRPASRSAPTPTAKAKAVTQPPRSRRASATTVSPSTPAGGVPDAGPPADVAPQPVTPQPAPAPAPTQQGWARRGYTTPPGEVRRAETPAPTTPPGETRRQAAQDPTTAPAPAAPVTPPGQEKKAEDPNPKG